MNSKTVEETRQNVNNCQEDTIGRDNKQYWPSAGKTVSSLSFETGCSVLKRTIQDSPANEAEIRGEWQ